MKTDHEFTALPITTPKPSTYLEKLALSNAISDQIWKEQSLVSIRMRWNFFFQGLLIGVYTYVLTELELIEISFIYLITIPLLGIFVSVFLLLAIRAAQKKSSLLRRHWVKEFTDNNFDESKEKEKTYYLNCNITDGGFPQPFSPRDGSLVGRLASVGIICLIIVLWCTFLFVGQLTVEGGLLASELTQ